MKMHTGFALMSCVLFAGLSTVAAQEQPSGTTPPPKVLVIMREFLKPGKAGSAHQKTESAFVQAFSQAKWPQHYTGMDSLSGKSRSLFFTGYDSFEAWEKDNQATQKNATLAAALDSAQAADGDLLDSYESSTFVYRDDLSLAAPVEIPKMRYMEITVMRIRPGHRQDFKALAKMYISAYQKANMTTAHWAAFEDMYGHDNGGKYILVTPMKSLAEVDQGMAAGKGFASAVGPDEMKKMEDLTASTIESSETNLFMFNPKISYAAASWVKADPAFWGQK